MSILSWVLSRETWLRGTIAMTDLARRGGLRPPVSIEDTEPSRMAHLVAAVRILIERTRPASRIGQLPETARQLVETTRRKLFTDRQRFTADYDAPRSEIAAFLVSCRRIFWGLAAFSGLSNILMLTGSFFMLQVYDRVLPGRSVPTLIALMALATMLYLFQGALDLVRNRISVRVGRHLDETLGLRVFDAMVRLPLKTRGDGDGLQPLRDLDQVRSFLSSRRPG